ncbi:MAG: DNA-directed RNA polymerase subunit omega [Oscillospiraceae bacterium]|nr:DNA-directed RNA polymerase subunit omega [Oscillospiraceae bacterium]
MLLYPAMNDLLKNVPSRYMLVNVVANRARKIAVEAEHSGIPLTEKTVSMAVKEVADGLIVIDPNSEAEEA